jgi:putative colanic acid biosynthesis UDP-glucose lipid carrier transferase
MANQGIIRPIDHQLGLLQRAVDVLLIFLTLFATVFIYLSSSSWNGQYTITVLTGVAIYYIAAEHNGLYQSYRFEGLAGELKLLFIAWLTAITGLLLLGYALKVTHELSRVVLGCWSIASPVALIASRALFQGALRYLRGKGYNSRSAVIVGVNDNAKHLACNILSHPNLGLTLKGFVSNIHSGDVLTRQNETLRVIGDSDALLAMAQAGDVDVVYIATNVSDQASIEGTIEALGDSTVSMYLVPNFYTAEIMQGNWVTVGDTPTVKIIDTPTLGIDSWVKRAEDIVISFVSLLLLAIPMAIIGLAVKLSSPGPAIFKQNRYGMNGRPISVWKFRSMTVAEGEDEFLQAKRNDIRVTKLGCLLRKTSLDELPQLINVLVGDMSIVGPRPHAVAHNEEFRGKVKGYMLRHKVKPGMTGLAQINGYRGETDTDEKMVARIRYDVQYINNWSLWHDLVIVVKTPWVLFAFSDTTY